MRTAPQSKVTEDSVRGFDCSGQNFVRNILLIAIKTGLAVARIIHFRERLLCTCNLLRASMTALDNPARP
jgi:hypothetical protein